MMKLNVAEVLLCTISERLREVFMVQRGNIDAQKFEVGGHGGQTQWGIALTHVHQELLQ